MLKFLPMWAIIKTGGKQYKVAVGDTISIERIKNQEKEAVTFSEVLALGGDSVKVGMPLVEKAKVTGKILEDFRGPKIRVVKFKSKSKYMRTTGHRQNLSKVLIEKIQE